MKSVKEKPMYKKVLEEHEATYKSKLFKQYPPSKKIQILQTMQKAMPTLLKRILTSLMRILTTVRILTSMGKVYP